MFNFLIPNFLQHYNQKLLKNKPILYSSRAHWVAYFGSIAAAVISFFCYVVTPNIKDSTNIFYSMGILVMLCIVGVVAWLIYLLRFNVFKKYAFVNKVAMVQTFVLYFFSFCIIIALMFIPAVIESCKTNYTLSKKQVTDNVNTLNKSLAIVHFTNIPKQWKADTLLVVNENDERIKADENTYKQDEPIIDKTTVVNINKWEIISTKAFEHEKTIADSILKLNDSVYIKLQAPNLLFISANEFRSKNKYPVLTNKEIYYYAQQHQNNSAIQKANQQIANIIEAYYFKSNDYNNFYDYEESKPIESNLYAYVQKKYKLYPIQKSINNIVEKQYRFSNENLFVYIRLLLYPALICALILFAFRSNLVKTFFITWLVNILLFIAIILLLSLLNSNINASAVTLFVWLIFALIAYTVFNSQKQKHIHGIAINNTMVLLPFVPTLIVAGIVEIQEKSINYTYTESLLYKYGFVAEIVGLILLLIALPTILFKLYTCWYALADE
jgi:hypothetical protein